MNYDTLAAVCGFKSKASASTRWSEAKKKLNATFGGDGMVGDGAANGGDDDGDAAAATAAAATPKKTPKKRTAKEAGATADGGSKKRGRKSKAEIAALAAAAKGEGEDDEDSKAVIKAEDDGIDKLLSGSKQFSTMNGAGLIDADSDDEV